METWLRGLYDAEEMRSVDRWAIEDRGVDSLELMENAGRAVAEAVAKLRPEGPVRVVCGKGNNGGDGLVAARLLREMGFATEVLLLWPAAELSDDASANLKRLEEAADGVRTSARYPGISANAVEVGADGDVVGLLAGSGVVVDAIFGTGFAGAPREPAASAIAAINDCGAPVVACDIVSGVDAATGEVAGAVVECDVTVTFHGAKVGHYVAPGKWATGELEVAPIGIPAGAPEPAAAGVIEPAVLDLAPRRGARSTKFSSGQVTIAGGSRGLTGAVRMSSTAAIRAGAGYATVAVPADLEPVFEAAEVEVMSRGIPGPEGRLGTVGVEALLDAYESAAAGVFGPGLGRHEDSLALARALVPRIDAPLVVDADGLNAFSGSLSYLAAREAPTVLTPHAGELGRLLKRESSEIGDHRLAAATEAASRSGAIVVLKGDDTIVTDGERVAVNAVAAPGLATAGSGDVLSGLTAALLARGLEPFVAACAAVIAHARAGQEAARRVGLVESVIATDVIAAIPAGLRSAGPVE
ncbi:MAG TPA: NAD(P)H-hydrate dehydratase [Solirubrobacterales bacterium]|jgi:NAD(P)H-hydrate epimerase|nr:NAD(P)H-hydrate dehydratase [Solirubrobacterales bacterium]